MADALSLLFELDVDGRPAAAGLQRFRKDIAATIDATRRAITQPLKGLNTAPITAAAKASAAAQEREQRRLNTAVQSLQRQRSSALIKAFKDEERAAIASARAQERAAQQASRSITNAFRGIGPGLQSIGRTLTLGITAPLLALGAASLKSAKDLDANVNTLKAFTGSAEAAEKRLAQLIKTARGTPGLTTNLALTLDAQLRVAKTTQETIDRVLPAIGRLNAVSKLPDPGRFVDNLKQLITQNFERQDLKELVGQSPLAGQLLTEIFNVDSPTNAAAIRASAKKLGLTSIDAFFNAFAAAAERNQGLANVTESIGTRFDKIIDRITVALRPIGLSILNAIEPFVEPVAKLIERIGAAFDSLSTPVKTAIIVIAGLAAAAGPVLFVLGGVATAITGVVTAIGTISAAVAAIGLPAIAAAVAGIVVLVGEWVAILAVLGLAWKTNFLNIQGLVTDAGRAVLEAFSRIKVVLEDAIQRILPTLQSITEKVLGAITAFWNKFGRDIVNVVRGAFEVTVRTLEAALRFLGNFVDLVAKLIDGDFRGAFRAFSRILVNAAEGLADFFRGAARAFVQGINRLIDLITGSAVRIAEAAKRLAERFTKSLITAFIASAPSVGEALATMLTLAVLTIDVGKIAATFAQRFIAAVRKAAAEGVTVPLRPVVAEGPGPHVGADAGGSAFRIKQSGGSDGTGDKGADTETRRRIRLLELEAERVEAIARQGIAAENIRFEQRQTSLKEFTDFQIREEALVLEKKKAVFAAERAEAEKLTKGRDLALGEIRLKELKAELDFADRKNQLLANQEREELEAAKAHRQALLDIQEQADDAELSQLEDFQRQGFVTAFDVASRAAEIEKAARARHKAELEIQLKEADKNEQDRGKLLDALKKFDDESAESVRRNERLKREALQETADAYRDYVVAIREALERTGEATRDTVAIALTRLNARVFLTQQQRIERQFAIDKSLLEAEKRASDLRIDNAEREAIEKAKEAGELERKLLEIERTFHDERLAEQKRFEEQKRKLEEDKKANLERADPSSSRSLFGDVFADTAEATGSVLAGFAATAGSIFADLSAQAGNFGTILTSVFQSVGEAVGNVVQNFVLLGNAGIGARKWAAQTIAAVAQMSVVKAVFELAEGFAAVARAIFGDPKAGAEAAMHFKSAAIYGAVAGIAAVAGRAVAGNSFSNNQGTASAAVNGGSSEPRNREFQYGGQGPVESASRAAQDGSGGFFGRVVDQIKLLQQQTLETQRQQMLLQGQTAQALNRIQSMPHGQALAIGAAENPAAVGQAVISHSSSSGDFNEYMQGIASGRG